MHKICILTLGCKQNKYESDCMARILEENGYVVTENLEFADKLGYTTVFWSLAYADWNNGSQPTREQALEKLVGRIHPGAIVLLHSTSATNAAVLDEVITRWKEMGYTFGSLSELCGQSGAH